MLKFNIFILVILMMTAICGITHAEESDFMIFYCGPYLLAEDNLKYSFSLEDLNEMETKDLAHISLYLAIMGNMKFGLNPDIPFDTCRKVLPEKYLIEKPKTKEERR